MLETRPTVAALGTRLTVLCDPLFGFARSRSASREAALDAVQEALTAALAAGRKGRGFGDDEELWAWLVGVTRHKLADEFRKRRGRMPTLTGLGLDAAVLADSLLQGQSMPPELAGRAEVAQVCRAALSELEPRGRNVLEAFYRDGKSHAEIASALGVSAKAVESLLARGRKHLHEVLSRVLAHPEELL